MRTAVVALVVACCASAPAAAQRSTAPDLNGKWTLDNEPTSVWTITQTGRAVTASRDGAPGHPQLHSRFRGELLDFGPYAIVNGQVTNTEGSAVVVRRMCWLIRNGPVRQTEFQWGDCVDTLGRFVRYTAVAPKSPPPPPPPPSTPKRPPPPPPPPSPRSSGGTDSSPNFTAYGPVLRG